MNVISQHRKVRQAKAFDRAPLVEVDLAEIPKSSTQCAKPTAAPQVGEPSLHLERDEQRLVHDELRAGRMRNRTGLFRSPGTPSHGLAPGTLADLTIEHALAPSHRKSELTR
jgi:hypothetical protein